MEKSSKWLIVLLVVFGSLCGFEFAFPILTSNKLVEMVLFIVVFRATQINVNELGDLLIDTVIVASCTLGWQQAILAPVLTNVGLPVPHTLIVFAVCALYFQYDRAQTMKFFVVSSVGIVIFVGGIMFLTNVIMNLGTVSTKLPPLSTMATVSIGYFLCNVFVSQMQAAPKWHKKPMAVMVVPNDDED